MIPTSARSLTGIEGANPRSNQPRTRSDGIGATISLIVSTIRIRETPLSGCGRNAILRRAASWTRIKLKNTIFSYWFTAYKSLRAVGLPWFKEPNRVISLIGDNRGDHYQPDSRYTISDGGAA